MSKISVTWKKSAIGFNKNQRLTIDSLGLRRLNHTVIHEDTPSIRGMVHKVRHLVVVEDIASDEE
jgi:large subunit ribosomal protein L30